MKNLLVMVASGFEDVELITTLDILSREGISYELVSIENKDIVKGKFNAHVKTSKFEDINEDNFNSIFLPGGPGVDILLKSKRLADILNKFKNENKVISAICAAPEVLFQAKIVDDVKITAYDNLAENGKNTRQEVEVDKNIVTGRDFLSTLAFANKLAEVLKK